jgi:glycosyltransferase involved in cell wall biosynthesis
MPGLYTACDCLVHPYRGEGFGLPVLEAMACGLPVIVTAGGATDDFCTRRDTTSIPSKPRRFTSRDVQYVGGTGWVLEPQVEALIKVLRHVYENQDEAMEKAVKALARVRSEYPWERVAERVLERMREIASRPIRRMQATLGAPASGRDARYHTVDR